jgi:hypothetical protein
MASSRRGMLAGMGGWFLSEAWNAIAADAVRLPGGPPARVPAVRSAFAELRAFGAKADGRSDDRQALLNAVASLPSGGEVLISDVHLFGGPIALPANVILVGRGKQVSVLRRGFGTGPLITSMGPYSGLRNLAIDGGGFPHDIVTMTGGITQHYQSMEMVRLFNTSTHALSFAKDTGAEFRAIGCEFMTRGKLGVTGAVATTETDTRAVPRHFVDCAGEGSTLYDFSGANDTFVHGGYSNGIITSDTTSKLTVSNFRVGAAAGPPTIKGVNLTLQNVVFANPVTLTCRDSIFNCIVPDWDVTDNGTGNSVFQRLRRYAPAWTASGASPVVGNGSLAGYFSRQGAAITVQLNLQFGSRSTFGVGPWRFSLPRIDLSPYVLTQAVGSGFTQAAGPKDFAVIPRVLTGSGAIELLYVDQAGTLQRLGGTTQAWAPGGSLALSFTYLTR